MREGEGVYKVLVGKLRERDHWGDPGVEGRIILRWIFRKWDLGVWTGLGWLGIETGAATCFDTSSPSSAYVRPSMSATKFHTHTKHTGKTIVLYILTFKVLDSKLEEITFCTCLRFHNYC
jgi:hypothetical protein